MTIRDTSKMTRSEMRVYERKLMEQYLETFGEGYYIPFDRPDTEVVVAGLIHCLSTGQKQIVPPEEPLPEGAVI